MPMGTIKKLTHEKGFGFIKPADGGADVFFHRSVVADQAFDSLTEGEQVEYSVDQGNDPKGKGPRANRVTLL